MSKINHRIVQRLFDPVCDGFRHALTQWLTTDPDLLKAPQGLSLSCVTDISGAQFKGLVEPQPHPGSTRIQLGVLREGCNVEDFQGNPSDVVFRLDVPLQLLAVGGRPKKYTLYHVRFAIDGGWIDEVSSSPLRNGYFGITGRSPFARLREHFRDAMSGRGHLLHKTWHGLEANNSTYMPVFQISGFADTLDEIYDYEERAVAELTLAPKGLNVIPGGHAGVRMLHQLRLLDRDTRVSEVERDDALIALEGRHQPGSPCTHYRSGHFRNLGPSRSTWVRPCWVNLKSEAV